MAITFGLMLAVVFGFMGLSLDLAQTYEMKTELQNAADAAALAGAKALNGTLVGINAAVSNAKSAASSNKFKYSTPVTLQDANISFGDDPDTTNWKTVAQAQSSPAGLLFIKVDTGSKTQDIVNFMKVAAVARGDGSTTAPTTYGSAVAGRFSLGISPIAVCALDPANKYGKVSHSAAGIPDELSEFGYRRGLTYDLVNLNPLGASANKYLLNPVDIPTGASDNNCNPSNGSTTTALPYICSGTASIITTLPGYVFANTGFQSSLNAEFNSRFLDPKTNKASCTTPPDANIREYTANKTGQGFPSQWMTPAPANQGVSLVQSGNGQNKITLPFTPPAASASNWGVLWSYSPAVQWAATPPSGGYTPYTTPDWSKLYPSTAAPQVQALPAYPTSTTFSDPPSPYNQSSGSQFFSQGSGSRDRRVLNVALADCSTYQSNGKCSTLKIMGIGRFFMPVQANIPSNLYVEFAGLVPDNELTTDIKLYH